MPYKDLITKRKKDKERYRKNLLSKKIYQKERRQRLKKSCPRCGRLMDYRARYCHLCRKGNFHPSWRGGRKICEGYIRIWCPTHPHADITGYVFEHRLIMECHIGRPLLLTEVVHHINGIPTDNRIENLMLFPSNVFHLKHHQVKKNE